MLSSRNLTRKFSTIISQTVFRSYQSNNYTFSKISNSKMSKDKFKVLMANATIPSVASEILKTDCDVIVCEEDRSTIMNNIRGVDALFWASYDIHLDKNLLDSAGPSLKVVGTMSAGYDKIDVEELKVRCIKFGNTPGVVGSAAAEQAILLALAASRRLVEGRSAIERSEWKTEFDTRWMAGMEISGSVVGIVGLGSIGQAIAQKLKGFEVRKFLYTGRKPKPEGDKLNAEFVSLEALVKQSDFVFSCVPLTQQTKNLFNYEVFSQMKKTAIFVNVGRGGSVNQPDLIRALRENLIFGAGLDVMSPEPLSPDDELLKLHNCVLAPHRGTSTLKTTVKMAELAANNILRALKGEPMLTPVI